MGPAPTAQTAGAGPIFFTRTAGHSRHSRQEPAQQAILHGHKGAHHSHTAGHRQGQGHAQQGTGQGHAQQGIGKGKGTHMHTHAHAGHEHEGEPSTTQRHADAGMDDSRDGATRRPRSARQYGTRYGLTYGRRTGRHTGTHTRPYRRPYRPGLRSTAQNGPNQATAGRSGIISPSKRLEALRGAILELEHAEALQKLPIVLHYRHATPRNCTRDLAKMPLQAPKNGARSGRIEAPRP